MKQGNKAKVATVRETLCVCVRVCGSHPRTTGRWRWAGPSLRRPSRGAAAGWRRRTPGPWAVRSRHCASAFGSASTRLRTSWCPAQVCSVCRCAESINKRSSFSNKTRLTLNTSTLCACKCVSLTRMSRQAALSSVIWSAMESVVKPGSCLANSTVLMMHLVDSSLNLSQRSTSSETRLSELLLCKQTHRHSLEQWCQKTLPLTVSMGCSRHLSQFQDSTALCSTVTVFSHAYLKLNFQ